MKNDIPNKEKDILDESVELSSQEKLEGQVRCLREMNKILKGAIERHETNRNNN
jgi:hypothetical protein